MNAIKCDRFLDDADFRAVGERARRDPDASHANAAEYAGLAQASVQWPRGDVRGVMHEATSAIAGVPGARADILTLPGPQVVLIVALPGQRVAGIDASGEPLREDGCVIAIFLTEGVEPATAEVRWLTALHPIFHPQVSALGRIAWLEPPTSWVELLRRLIDMAAYRVWSATQNVMNRSAAAWAANHEESMPLA